MEREAVFEYARKCSLGRNHDSPPFWNENVGDLVAKKQGM